MTAKDIRAYEMRLGRLQASYRMDVEIENDLQKRIKHDKRRLSEISREKSKLRTQIKSIMRKMKE